MRNPVAFLIGVVATLLALGLAVLVDDGAHRVAGVPLLAALALFAFALQWLVYVPSFLGQVAPRYPQRWVSLRSTQPALPFASHPTFAPPVRGILMSRLARHPGKGSANACPASLTAGSCGTAVDLAPLTPSCSL